MAWGEQRHLLQQAHSPTYSAVQAGAASQPTGPGYPVRVLGLPAPWSGNSSWLKRLRLTSLDPRAAPPRCTTGHRRPGARFFAAKNGQMGNIASLPSPYVFRTYWRPGGHLHAQTGSRGAVCSVADHSPLHAHYQHIPAAVGKRRRLSFSSKRTNEQAMPFWRLPNRLLQRPWRPLIEFIAAGRPGEWEP